ncbi:aminodeoxychorismate synthase component I [Paracoccus fistulariae]|uniref:Aminodeoxychorismate synthase component I n=1 Tax=Paracoccus fistulariae TaxID=658446 RepID=A0ABY7SM61_9RHOB|nr:aminodeoxychorismate synthase component I [Paracoccus fistulariae]MDB6180010.1 aminodeoxychorismate synthase component I [Paracoccus fistulariae]WCR08101.1 aminodeoxychorismate synthase component I [Paracoccus fistulariae]
MSGRLLFDQGPLAGGTLFRQPRDLIRADSIAEVSAALARVEDARASGLWVAGYLSYELGYALIPRLHHLMPEGRAAPLILMGVFDGPEAPPDLPRSPVRIGPAEPLWSRADYDAAIAAVRRYIEAGDCYQINLTFPMRARVSGDPLAIYAELARRQPVGEGAFVDLDGAPILSRSPELFFAVDADRQIATRPMKGTMPRGATPEQDLQMAEALAASEKNRAENLMIVDLLRNDLSRVCLPGSVRVPQLFQIEPYATVFQMTSTVTGQLHQDAGLAQILTALFPCGSITGAPKIRAMEIIAELEQRPRDIYCGAIGWLDPAGPMRFNVAIRSPVLEASGQLHLQVGGGIVHDSEAGSEWEEALCKSAFLGRSPQI